MGLFIHSANIVCDALHLPLFIEDGLTEWLTESLVGKDNYTPPSPTSLKKTFKNIDVSYKSFLHPTFPESEPELLVRMKHVVDGLCKKYKGKNLLLVSHAPCDLAIALALSNGTPEKHDLDPYPLGGVFQFTSGSKGTFDALDF